MTEDANIVLLTLPEPHKGQLEVFNSQVRFKILCCGRRWGKSLLCSLLALVDMLDGKQVAYISPTHDLNRLFFKQILQYIPQQIITADNKSELNIELSTGGSLKFFSAESYDQFRGRSFDLAIIDESAYINDLKEAWNSAIRPTLTDRKGKAIFVSTPRGKNYFHALYQEAQYGKPNWAAWAFSTYDNPYIDKAEIDEAKENLPKEIFDQEYMAIPSENSGSPFGIENINKNIIPVLSTRPAVIYAIDLGRINDYTVIIGLDDSKHMCYFQRFKLPWTVTKERIKELPDNISKVIDATGVGDPVYEDLSLTINNLVPFKFTGESKPRIITELIIAVQKGDIKYNQITADEMSTFEYKVAPSGAIKYSAMPGYHDDCVASLALVNSQWKNYRLLDNWDLWVA